MFGAVLAGPALAASCHNTGSYETLARAVQERSRRAGHFAKGHRRSLAVFDLRSGDHPPRPRPVRVQSDLPAILRPHGRRRAASPTASPRSSSTPSCSPRSKRNTACRRRCWSPSGAWRATSAPISATTKSSARSPRSPMTAGVPISSARNCSTRCASSSAATRRVDSMIGDWAGEFGGMQFTASDYLKNAVDFDGDGRRDLIHSIPDTLASGANFLVSLGWQRGEPWLQEVRVPQNLPWQEADLTIKHPRSQWVAWGVQGGARHAAGRRSAGVDDPADGPPRPGLPRLSEFPGLPRLEFGLRLFDHRRLFRHPACRRADRRPRRRQDRAAAVDAAGDGFAAPADQAGYEGVGEIDGKVGSGTRAAVKKAQMKLGLPADSYPTAELIERLGGNALAGSRASFPPRSRHREPPQDSAAAWPFISCKGLDDAPRHPPHGLRTAANHCRREHCGMFMFDHDRAQFTAYSVNERTFHRLTKSPGTGRSWRTDHETSDGNIGGHSCLMASALAMPAVRRRRPT